MTGGVAVRSGIGFSGKLRDFPIRNVLRMLCLSSRTGSLQLADDGRTAQIDFDRGKIIRAWTQHAHENLGEILLRRSLLSQSALTEAVRMQNVGAERLPLGQILVRLGFVSEQDINEAMREQVQAVILGVVCWTQGEFTFVDTLSSAVDDIAMGVSDALLPAARIGRLQGTAGTLAGAGRPRFEEAPQDPQRVPIICIGGSSRDWTTFVATLAESFPGAVIAAAGEDPVGLVRRAFRVAEEVAVLIDGRQLSPDAERGRMALVARLRRRFPAVPLIVVHDGISRAVRARYREAGVSALADLATGSHAVQAVERPVHGLSEAMTLALSPSSWRPHAVEDPGC